MATVEGDQPTERRSLLKAFYGLDTVSSEREEVKTEQNEIPELQHDEIDNSSKKNVPEIEFVSKDDIQDPVDINGKYFVSKKYVDKILSECTLTQLDEENTKLSQQVRQLDSDIQTLVYENYSKFIAATETIRKMRQDFKNMEQEMEKLEHSMVNINDMSSQIDTALSPHKSKINKLASIHELLRKLQFLYGLPGRLNKCLEMNHHVLAVRYHLRALPILQRYKDTPAFFSIHEECTQIIQQLTTKLHTTVQNTSPFSDENTESVDLLLKLGEDRQKMVDLFMVASRIEIDIHFQKAIKPQKTIEEYIRVACGGLLFNIHRLGEKFRELFTSNKDMKAIFDTFIHDQIHAYLTEAETFLLDKVPTSDPVVLVRSLDKLYRQVIVITSDDVCESLVSKIALSMIQLYQNLLQEHFYSLLEKTFSDISKYEHRDCGEGELPPLANLYTSLHDEFRSSFKANLIALKEFISSSIKFSQNRYFRQQFCAIGIQDGLVKKTFNYVLETSESFPSSVNIDKYPAFLLVLCRFCMELYNSTISFLTSKSDEMFQAELSEPLEASPVKNTRIRANKTASNLLNRFVYLSGDQLSQLFSDNLVTQDWMLPTTEPNDVTLVIKRSVDELSYLDSLAGMLFVEGVKEESSEGSKKNYLQGYQQRKLFHGHHSGSSQIGSINVSRLFSERMTYYYSVNFNKFSILTGIIKITLKGFLEAVRACTFGKYGLQQMQLDLAYLHIYIWRFVANENLILDLIEDILTSSVSRCIDPILMDTSVIDLICQEK
ncbi:Vacuolar protein sorting-associated protein 51-like [Oopsacas minuta]|uniref:Vacuolar protein sorting-associated protein 51 homolog n=1 Tax=Oopsacas minuta TaxID=111878 RepID=A0AAV7KL92_9METZ|nr:Vacuolar protein sorting-associated protein 51-like [Oopsacas minuta]